MIARLGETPCRFAPATPSSATVPVYTPVPPAEVRKELVGIDVFVDRRGTAEALADALHLANGNALLRLEMITNRGVKVWPHGLPETFTTDHWRCRFVPRGGCA